MKKIINSIGGVALSLLLPSIALAEDITILPQDAGAAKFSKLGTGTLTFSRVISFGITMLLIFASLLFFFMLVIGGIRWIMSGGEKANVENARKQITNALIGLAIIFVAWAIIRLLATVFGVNILTLPIPTL